MRREHAWGALLLLMAAPSAADATAPTPPPKNSWVDECAALLERARDDAARKNPSFARGALTVVRSVDFPSVRLATPNGIRPAYEVEVSRVGLGWGNDAWHVTRYGSDASDADLDLTRHHNGRAGSLVMWQAGKLRRIFLKFFQRAVDECLAVGK
jgi:hypothetical protein